MSTPHSFQHENGKKFITNEAALALYKKELHFQFENTNIFQFEKIIQQITWKYPQLEFPNEQKAF